MSQYDSSADTRSIYIHWPFCPYKCHYCPFVAISSHDEYMEHYHKALVKEITHFAQKQHRKLVLDTIYLGGGTPSTYPDELLLDTFGILKNSFIFDSTAEVTLEVNPGTVTLDKLDLWRSLGINRISVGVQSLNNEVLHRLNRKQDARDVYFLMEHAPHYFNNISIDLILGLPGVSQAEWRALIQEVATWPISHLSLYFLTVHEDTPLYFKLRSKRVSLPDDEYMLSNYYWARDYLQEHGLYQYEVSSYARAQKESRHNTVYWDRKPFKAFGLGACSFDGLKRLQNEKNLMTYMHAIEQGSDITVFCEELTAEQVRIEKVMLGLRRKVGVPMNLLHEGLTVLQKNVLDEYILSLKQKNLISTNDGSCVLTAEGLVLENEIITKLSTLLG